VSKESIEQLATSLAAVSSVEQFKAWTRNQLRPVLPHGALICGLGHLHAGGVGLDYLVTVDYPTEHIEAIRNRAGAIDTPILRRWLTTQAPVMFDADEPWPETPKVWLESFRRHQMQNVVADAVYDHVRCVGTYHSVYRLPPPLTAHHADTLHSLVPAMHDALCRVIQRATVGESLGMAVAAMSERERQVIHWLRLGKTNAEIGLLVNLSENTVKHHLTNIFDKFGVSNRAQLVRNLLEIERRQVPGSGTQLL
jgi:DNA-binding CsgD family transcriptional regulator